MSAAMRPTTKPTLVHSADDDTISQFGEPDQSIGQIIRETKNLSEDQISAILDYQRSRGMRFGEAAVALGLASNEDIVFALSQQFHYPYSPEARRSDRPELVASSQPFGQQAEAFRAIRSQLMLRTFSPDQPRRALAVISPQSGDGKTFFVANLGVVMAQLGGRVLLVDADLRGPRLHAVFGVPNVTGISSVLSGRKEESVIYQAPDIPNLFIMPVGVTPPNPLELIERPAFRLLMGEVIRKFDHVIVDTPARQYGSDAVSIASKCGAALVLARKDRTRSRDLQELVDSATATAARMAGIIVNEF